MIKNIVISKLYGQTSTGKTASNSIDSLNKMTDRPIEQILFDSEFLRSLKGKKCEFLVEIRDPNNNLLDSRLHDLNF